MNKQLEGFAAIIQKPHLLWNNVDKSGDCWNWTKRTTKSGYGSIRVATTSVLAHRAAFLLSFRYIDNNGCICHICDNPKCCNPSHLFIDSHAGNMQDMKEKRRRKGIGSCENNGRAKLTHESVNQIRALRNSGMMLKELADQFGVGLSSISRVCRMENWK